MSVRHENPTSYPWLDEAWEQFKQYGERLPHALLLEGPPGVGKTALSLAMARYLICDSPTAESLFDSANHPDLHLISTEAKTAQEAGIFDQFATRYLAADAKTASRKPRRIISVDQVRQLIERFHLTQHSSAHKVALITPAEAMNINASNALLKLLEEPPEDAVLILCTDNASRLPITVLSRCVRLHVAKPERQLALSWLTPQLANSNISPAEALALCAGSPLQALDYEQSGEQAEFHSLLSALQDLLEQKIDPVVAAEQMQKLDLSISLNRLQHILAAIIAERLAMPTDDWWAQQLSVVYQAAQKYNIESICCLYDSICELKRHDVAQLNPQMLFEQITFQLTD